jgi:hypothetical protein
MVPSKFKDGDKLDQDFGSALEWKMAVNQMFLI